MADKVYTKIVNAVKAGILTEPFSVKDFRIACPGLGNGTYNAFLYKHRRSNPGRKSELFELISPGNFKCIRPFKYGL
jgi:hypothetical protein